MNICDLMWIMPECLVLKGFEFFALSLHAHLTHSFADKDIHIHLLLPLLL